MHSNIRYHITQTYVNLRIGVAIMALALPMLMLLGAWYFDSFDTQQSISRYYHTPMRDIFVGILVSIGAFLYLYKGFTTSENIALNVAGILAVLVALLPTNVSVAILQAEPPVTFLPAVPFVVEIPHKIAAVLFFVTIAYVAVYSSEATLCRIEDNKKRALYRACYRVYGVLMITLPIAAGLLSLLTLPKFTIFIIETIAIAVFSAFWITKSFEVKEQADRIEIDLIAK